MKHLTALNLSAVGMTPDSTKKDWKGELEQVDDICVMGVKI